MDRRHLVLSASTAAALSPLAHRASVAAQPKRSSAREYVGVMIAMRRSIDWIQTEGTRLLDARDPDDDEWRVDVLGLFVAVDVLRETALTIVPPRKHETTQEQWLDALDEFVAAGLHLRTAVLDDNVRSYEFATRALDRAAVLLEEVDGRLPRRVHLTTD